MTDATHDEQDGADDDAAGAASPHADASAPAPSTSPNTIPLVFNRNPLETCKLPARLYPSGRAAAR